MTRKKDPRSARLPVPARELPAFAPVPRRCQRHDGWTPDRQRAFTEEARLAWLQHLGVPATSDCRLVSVFCYATAPLGEWLSAMAEEALSHATATRVLLTPGHATRLARAHAGQTLVLVAHGGVLDCLYRAASRIALNAPRTWELPNTGVNRLLWTGEGFTLVGWGDVHHLDDEARDESADRVGHAA